MVSGAPMRLAFLASALLALTACKQGEGEYCQVNADCKDGLVCAQITDTCEKSATTPTADAGPDAELLDAMPPDATPQCSDGIDNEAVPDTLIDFPDDPQCIDAADNDEEN